MRHKRYSTSDIIKLEGFITLQETQAYITVDGTLTRAHLEYIIIIIITCNLKYSECFGKKRWTIKLERTKQLFNVCDHPCHSRLLLVSINPWPWPWPFFSQCFTVGNDGHCWRFDGLKESTEVDSSTMELWSVCAKGTLWSPILHTFPINLPLVFEAIL